MYGVFDKTVTASTSFPSGADADKEDYLGFRMDISGKQGK